MQSSACTFFFSFSFVTIVIHAVWAIFSYDNKRKLVQLFDANGAWRAAWSSTAAFWSENFFFFSSFFDMSVVILGLLLIVPYVHE